MEDRLLPASEVDPGDVYAMKCAGFVKIGWSSQISRRLNQIRSCNPRQVHLLGTVKGDVGDEHMLHLVLRQEHYRGEWFRYQGFTQMVSERFKEADTAKEVIEWIENIRKERLTEAESQQGKEWYAF